MSTIEDVAKACGMAKSTVSRVINQSERNVSARTREHVMKVVREMNYQPSALAQGLSKQRSNMIGIVTKRLPHILTDVYYSSLIDSIVEVAADLNQTVALYSGRIWRDDEKRNLVFADGRCDGLLLLMSEHDPHLTTALLRNRIPFVCVNSGVRVPGINSIDIDNVEAGYIMTRLLVERGHTRIACIHTADTFSVERSEGYAKALREANLEFDGRLVKVGYYAPATSGYHRAQELISDRELGVSAIFAATDALAVDAIHGVKDIGLRVPQDVSIVGINNTQDALRCNPSLTTLSQSVDAIGGGATRMLMEIIDRPDAAVRHVVWPTQIIERESVAQFS